MEILTNIVMNKRILIIAAAAFATCFSLSAQKKGDMVVGGSLSLTGTATTISSNIGDGDSEGEGDFAFQIAPSFGYFIADKLLVGGEIGFESKDDISALTIAPFAQYYIPLLGNILSYTPGVSIGVGFGFAEETSPFLLAATISPFALEIKPTRHIGINVSLGSLYYSMASTTIESEVMGKDLNVTTTTHAYGFEFKDAINSIGVRYYF